MADCEGGDAASNGAGEGWGGVGDYRGGVSASGRAFAACKWLIDQLKFDVPIWKKEIWADGAESWVHP